MSQGPASELRLFMSRLRRTPWRTALRQALRSHRRDGMLLPERLEGAVYGHLVGDALGVPYEFEPPDRIGDVVWRGGGVHGQPPGTWSDDGALMLALLDSLMSRGPVGAFDPADQARRALAWFEEGRYAPGSEVFDVGNATRHALGALRAGTPPEEAGAVEARGNGSLMRILSLALVFREVEEAGLVSLAARASRLTHGSAEAQLACALYALIVRRLLRGESDREAVLVDARRELRRALAASGLPGSREASAPHEALAQLDAFEAWPTRRGDGRVVDSFWSAWDAFAGAPDYVTTVTSAVRYGNDTDTTAAIAGGLAGTYWGIEAIPAGWRRGLRDPGVARDLADRLIETDASEWDGTPWRTSRASPLRVDLVELHGTDLDAAGGALGMTFLPGKRYLGYYSGPHWRDLDRDAARLRELAIDVLLLLVEDHELERCRVGDLGSVLGSHEVEVVRFPIVDPDIPADGIAFRTTLRALLERIRSGARVAVACRGGLDRSGMTVACLLREAGLDADEAIGRVHRARAHTLTMPPQLRYVRDWPPSA